jgi:glycosyltransferase involved in cell wall biosynthesis
MGLRYLTLMNCNLMLSMREMKVVLVNIWLDAEHGAGTAERARRLARALADLGCDCSILTMGPTPWNRELSAGRIDLHSIGYFGRRFPVPLPHPLRLWRLIRNADIVHVTGHWYLLAAAVCFIGRSARVPVVLCPAGELLAFNRRQWWKRIYHCIIGRHAVASAALIIAVTGQERDDLVRRYGIKPSRIILVPNGVTLPAAIENGGLSRPTRSFVLFVGRLAWVKGPDLLVEAFARISSAFPDIDLVMIGPDFGLRRQLEARAHDLGLAQRICFLGFVDEVALQRFYREAAFLALPSRSEVMSFVALEAAVAGTPVLLTKSCGFDEVEEIGGGLVVAADHGAIAQGLMTMLSDQAELRAMGQRLREFVLQNYAWPQIASNLRDELIKLV